MFNVSLNALQPQSQQISSPNQNSECGEENLIDFFDTAFNPLGKKEIKITEKKFTRKVAADDTGCIARQHLRRGSTSDLDYLRTQPSEAEQISKKDSALWECMSRKPNKGKGHLYTFKLKEEFNILKPNEYQGDGSSDSGKDYENGEKLNKDAILNLNKKYQEIFPAIESSELHQNINDYDSPVFHLLGYDSKIINNEIYIALPDREALDHNWKKLREKRPDLPALSFISSDGIAGDMDFVEAYISHDGLLSDGEEFIHDHGSHLMPALHLMYSHPQSYPKLKYQLVMQSIIETYSNLLTIKHADLQGELKDSVLVKEIQSLQNKQHILETILGAYVDTVSSLVDVNMLSQIEGGLQSNLSFINVKDWKKYFNKRFGFDRKRSCFSEINKNCIPYIPNAVEYLDLIRFRCKFDEPIYIKKFIKKLDLNLEYSLLEIHMERFSKVNKKEYKKLLEEILEIKIREKEVIYKYSLEKNTLTAKFNRRKAKERKEYKKQISALSIEYKSGLLSYSNKKKRESRCSKEYKKKLKELSSKESVQQSSLREKHPEIDSHGKKLQQKIDTLVWMLSYN